MSPLYTGPMNPYLFSLTSLALLGLSYVTYHHFRGDHTGPASGNLTTQKPAIIVKEVEDAIEVIMPKALLPEEDTMGRTLPNIPTVNYSSITEPIPKAFDAREAWPKCSSVIGKVWDQGACQSCWAVSAAAVMTDRLCITSQAAPSLLLSPQHLICSCTNCTSRNANLPLAMPRCQGGDSEAAWQFWVQEGLVSGGDFGTNQSCLPYLTKPCLHNPAMPPILQVVPALLSCSLLPVQVYKCPDTCANSVGKVADEKKYKGSSFYYINNRTEDIQREIMLNGPVQAKFMFEEKSLRDFSGKGLYTVPERAGEPKHLHSVKIIGWNQTETGDSYWLCVNSYGALWGDGGLFRIKRGVNMYLIEESVMAGIPLPEAEVTTVSS